MAEIWSYLAVEVSPKTATKFIERLEAAFEPIRHFPLAAPRRDELAAGLHVAFHDRYAIYYRPASDAIVIIRVLHGARDIALFFESENP